MRRVLALLLLAGSSFAQTRPDFSGVFLRTTTKGAKGHLEPAVPRILDIKQASDEITVTAMQNGETAIAHYRFNNKTDAVQARWKGKSLQLVSQVVPRLSSSLTELSLPPRAVHDRWELSDDGSQLVIREIADAEFAYSEIYEREPALDAAQAAATAASRNECERPFPLPLPKSELDPRVHAVALGAAFFPQVTRTVVYDASLSGEFFKNLARSKDQSGFRKDGQDVTAYAGDLVLEVGVNEETLGPAGWISVGPTPDAVRHLRFMVRWLGAVQRDLGELDSSAVEFLSEPWRETLPMQPFYRMRISAQGIPLSDDLEVVIFSGDARQLACIKGHI